MTGLENRAPEMSRIVKIDRLPDAPLTIEASEDERRKLAGRFGLPAFHTLVAEIALQPDGDEIAANGTLSAEFDQACAVSGEPFANRIVEPVALRFVPAYSHADAASDPEEEIELSEEELDEVPYEGQSFDIGEAIAQSFGLAIDPYARGPEAEAAREDAGLDDPETGGAFAALAALKKD
ncbi:MAG: DUF177 domain-containing protein [Erythrobacter sp.]|nr:DUF177 domain-containing protein [Erythrobacter sp.]